MNDLGEVCMKRLLVLIIVLSLLVVAGTIVSAEAQTRGSRFGRKAHTAAIIAGGTAVGAVVAGKKGAAIGGGGAGVYPF